MMSMSKRRGNRPQLTALVVDDDMAQRFLMVETLLENDLLVEEAADGQEALELFKNITPDIVLMDVKMPRMDGFAACKAMRQLPEGQDLVIVLVTGLDDFESIQKAFDVGATDFITKPVNWPLLNHRVWYLLRASEAFRGLRRSKNRLAMAQEIARLGNWEWDVANDHWYWSEQMYQIYGLDSGKSVLSQDVIFEFIHSDDREMVKREMTDVLLGRKDFSLDYRIVVGENNFRTVHEQGEVFYDEHGKAISIHGTLQDITDRIRAEEQIRFLAYYDSLTGLPNRQLFMEHVAQSLRAAIRNGSRMALLYLDLDRFKRINDTLGHGVGDQLLKKISAGLADCVRSSDVIAKINKPNGPRASLSRLAGDEFTILLTDIVEDEHAGLVAKRVLEMVNQPITVDGQELYVSASIGISLYPRDGDTVDLLLGSADVAMFHAKEHGRNCFMFFSNQMNSRALERLNIENDLKRAVERDELVLFYQPQIDMQTGKLAGFEALVRWQHPEHGLVPPFKFIPVAEESGLIVPISDWVLYEACRQNQEWIDAGFAPVRMGVNISSVQFIQQKMTDVVENALQLTGLDPQYLELELTESAIMQNVEKVTQTLAELKSLGLTLSVDDFGTGYSSMSYLKRFPLDTLKIDRSFIMDITVDENDAAIVKAIIALAKILDLKTICEGVETKEQLEFLRTQGGDELQGFLVSKPVPAKEAEVFLAADGRFC
jgi:diguanylate cyclase (GGDEF)-like protein/PAS domain S-box-containing protein